jgi:ATP-dependent exoDNAse (exonuclease V) beta subunit
VKDKLIASMKTLQELEDYIEKTEDKSLSMIVEVVKEFGNKLPGLISELKTNHSATKEEADMIFSTVHRCKGMEYDEVTLLNDFINPEKLKKYVSQLGGDNLGEADKNRLAEEINILYVAVTRAKNKLKIPPEINPLQSIELAQQQQAFIPATKKYQRGDSQDDWEPYARPSAKKAVYNSPRPGNYGKKWTSEEEHKVTQLYKAGNSIKQIAKQVSRGESGVLMKLVNLGLADENDLPF